MAPMLQWRGRLAALIAALVLARVLASPGTSPAAANSTLLWLNPSSAAVDKGAMTDLDVQLDNAANVYAAQISLSFDPAVLQVVDADGGKEGVQISPGSCPQSDFVVVNSADNVGGTVQYAVTQLNPTPPCSGGQMATVQFLCIASGASSDVSFTDSLISDPNGAIIPHTTQNGSVSCNHALYLPLILNGYSP